MPLTPPPPPRTAPSTSSSAANPYEGGSGYQSFAAIGPLGPPPGTMGYAGPTPPPPTSPGNTSERTIVLVLAAVVVTLLLGVVSFVVVRSLISDDPSTVRQTSSDPAPTPPATVPPTPGPTPSPEPAPAPSPESSPESSPRAGEPTALQCFGGLPDDDATGREGRLMTGGGLALPQPRGFGGGADDQGSAFTFADGVYAPSMLVEQGPASSWVAVYALGGLNRGNGFDSPRQAAETVAACMSGSPAFYSDPTGSTELDSARSSLGGDPAWVITQEIRIDDPGLEVEGDIAKIVVVDTGDPAVYGLFVSVVPIGDQAMIDAQDAAVGELRVP